MADPKSLEVALQLLISLITDVSFLPVAVPLVLLLTSIAKKYIPINPVLIALTFQVAVWVVWAALVHFKVDPAVFDNGIKFVTAILTTLSGFTASTYLGQRAYRSAENHDVPLIGSSQNAYADQLKE